MASMFSRKTILAATDLLANLGHAALTRLLMEYGLEGLPGASLRDRANTVARHLLQNPEAVDGDDTNLTDAIVVRMVADAIAGATSYDGFSAERFGERNQELKRGLERDGFTVEDGQLRRALPAALDLPAADDEVHALLRRYGFATPAGHLDQAVAAHVRGEWAAANAQLRVFTESLLDDIAAALAPAGAALPPPGHQRRQWLANLDPAFFSLELNEWSHNGQGFIEAFYRRLHPQGAHPGLSDEEDSTFRLHLVLLVGRLLLRRLQQRRPG